MNGFNLLFSPFTIILLVILAILFFVIAAKEKQKTGLPGGKIVYSDTNLWQKVEIPLYHPSLKLAGRPDYIVQQGNQFIPIEVKSGRTPKAPYDSHIFQLAAYCLLIENEYGIRPSHGLIHYNDKDYKIDFTKELEASTLMLISEMQNAQKKKEIHCSHAQPQKCRCCGFREICDESLV